MAKAMGTDGARMHTCWARMELVRTHLPGGDGASARAHVVGMDRAHASTRTLAVPV